MKYVLLKVANLITLDNRRQVSTMSADNSDQTTELGPSDIEFSVLRKYWPTGTRYLP